jgi:hypothetical protein
VQPPSSMDETVCTDGNLILALNLDDMMDELHGYKKMWVGFWDIP